MYKHNYHFSPKHSPKPQAGQYNAAHNKAVQNKISTWERAQFNRRTFFQVSSALVLAKLASRTKSVAASTEVSNNSPQLVRANLPIAAYKEQICNAVNNARVSIITAETGAGKSTQVPQYLAEQIYKVPVLQPRRFAAASLAARVKEEYSQGPDKVGFKHALENRSVPNADIIYYTDGYFLQLMQSKQFGPNDVIVLDEVHEYSEAMEAVLAVLQKRMRQVDNGAKLVIMSATMDPEPLQKHFAKVETGIPVINVPGRTFGQTEIQPEKDILNSIVKQVEQKHDTLVFLSGKAEIAFYENQLKALGVDAEIMPLHSQLPGSVQDLVHKKYARPRVILATNIAQTSVTIDGIDTVIVSGWTRKKRIENGIEVLTIEEISQAEFLQQIGRVGRTKIGFYINHGRPFDQLNKEIYAPIQNSTLESLFLRLIAAGEEPEKLKFVHQPSRSTIKNCFDTLELMGLIYSNRSITSLGEVVARMPLDVRPGKLLAKAAVAAKTSGPDILAAAIDIAAIMQVEGLFDSGNGSGKSYLGASNLCFKWARQSDLLGQLCFLNQMKKWSVELSPEEQNKQHEKYNVNQHAVTQFNEYRSELRRRLIPKSGFQEYALSEQLLTELKDHICYAWSDMIFVKKSTQENGAGLYKHVLDKGKDLRMQARESKVRSSGFVIGTPINIQTRDDNGGIKTSQLLISNTAVSPEWLMLNAPQAIRNRVSDSVSEFLESERGRAKAKRKKSKGPQGSLRLPGRKGARRN